MSSLLRSQSGVIQARENGLAAGSEKVQDEPNASGSAVAWQKEPAWQNALIFLIIAGLNLIVFHRTINGYFLADDLVHVSYLSKVFDGHPQLLLQNFYSNWMQTQGTEFYRPVISLTLALDFMFWKASALGYHLSNLAFQTLSSFFLFLTVKRMFPETAAGERVMSALVASCLFACHPLHPEVVSWIIGRVDSVTTTFLFLSFYLYLKASQQRSIWFKTASITTFILALMSKEMAITLPPAIFLYEVLAGSDARLSRRFLSALKQTGAYFGVLILYLLLRALALGTITGGYQGSIADGLNASLIKRWFLDGSLSRMLLPFNEQIFSPGNKIRNALKLLYVAALIMFCVRSLQALKNETGIKWLPLKKMAFAWGWLVISLAPTVQVWNLTPHLQGSRFVYLATAPLSLILSWLIFPGCKKLSASGRSIKRMVIPVLTALSVVVLYAWIAQKNNAPWAKAMRSVASLRSQLEKQVSALAPDENIVLLNLPQQYRGAHMLYNAATFEILLKPPLSSADFAKRIYTFEPVTYGDSQLINASRFRRLLKSGAFRVLSWNEEEELLKPAPVERSMPAHAGSGKVNVAGQAGAITLKENECLIAPVVSLPGTQYDIVEVDVTVEPQAGENQPNLLLGWVSAQNPVFVPGNQLTQPLDKGHKIYRFHVSERKGWLSAGNITQLKLDVYPKPAKLLVHKIEISSSADQVPLLEPDNAYGGGGGKTLAEDNSGIARPGAVLGPFRFDASRIPAAESVRYEISRPDAWFEHYTGTLRDSKISSKGSMMGVINQIRGDAQSLDASGLPGPGFYELRIFALDSRGEVLGFSSDPLNFQLGKRDFAQSRKRHNERQ